MAKSSRRRRGKDQMERGDWVAFIQVLRETRWKDPLSPSEKASAVLCRLFCVPTIGTETRQRGKAGGEEWRWVSG